jgi:type I restriction enzyme R subunit
VVDYLGIAQDLKKALSAYTESGGKGKPAFDQEEAVRAMMEYYEAVVELFSGFDYRRFFKLKTPEENSGFCRLQPTISCLRLQRKINLWIR